MTQISAALREDILSALRQGTVPPAGLGQLAVGLDHLKPVIDEELDAVARGSGRFKAIRADFGGGKTFATRWIADQARAKGFLVSEVQISETETPPHHLDRVYRRLVERLSTPGLSSGAFPDIVNGWLLSVRTAAIEGGADPQDAVGLASAIRLEMDRRLLPISATAPMFATALRSYQGFVSRGDQQLAEGALAWLGAQPNVPADVTRAMGVKGAIDPSGALTFLAALLHVIRDSGRPGLVVVLDELETIQRFRADVRDKSLNALRQLLDELGDGRFPGLYLLVTGTPQFFEGPSGVKRLAPLAQRLDTQFRPNPKFDNLRAPQIRLRQFDLERLIESGTKVRAVYASHAASGARIATRVDDAFIGDLARAVAGRLGGEVGLAPRRFLRALVDELDTVDQHADYDPREDGGLEISFEALSLEEQEAMSRADPDAVDIDLMRDEG